MGWRALGEEVETLARRTGARTIVAEQRDVIASLMYYQRDTGRTVLSWPTGARPQPSFRSDAPADGGRSRARSCWSRIARSPERLRQLLSQRRAARPHRGAQRADDVAQLFCLPALGPGWPRSARCPDADARRPMPRETDGLDESNRSADRARHRGVRRRRLCASIPQLDITLCGAFLRRRLWRLGTCSTDPWAHSLRNSGELADRADRGACFHRADR